MQSATGRTFDIFCSHDHGSNHPSTIAKPQALQGERNYGRWTLNSGSYQAACSFHQHQRYASPQHLEHVLRCVPTSSQPREPPREQWSPSRRQGMSSRGQCKPCKPRAQGPSKSCTSKRTAHRAIRGGGRASANHQSGTAANHLETKPTSYDSRKVFVNTYSR